MEIKELTRRIRYIEVVTRRKVDEALSGAYTSVFKGRGIEFAEVREYMPGDDVRSIDWNVTARQGHPFTKKFVEERQLNIALAVDISSSMDFSLSSPTKRELCAEVCGALGFSSLRNNDRISLFTFADKVYTALHSRRGRQHILRILREVLTAQANTQRSSLKELLTYLLDVLKKRTIVFLVSDFFCEDDFWKELGILSQRHDVIAIMVRDDFELAIPYNVGRLFLEDPETGNSLMINTHRKDIVDEINRQLEEERTRIFDGFKRYGVDYIAVSPSSGWLVPMISFFKNRGKRRR